MQQVERPTTAPGTEAGLDFEGLFRAEYARLVGALQLLTANRAEAEDLAQDALSRVYERWDRVGGMDSPVGYLYRTALNLHRKRWRKLVRVPRDSPPSDAQDPAVVAERRAAIREALRSLSTEQREALVMVEWLGFSPTQAAGLLRVSPEALRARLHRARTSLRERFGGSDG